MKFEAFIERYDKENSIILLEGKRDVRDEDIFKLIALGKKLAENTKNAIFRSGNAKGSDQYFSQGIASVSSLRLEVITPYSGHRSKKNQASTTYSLDDINLAEEPEVVYHSKSNYKTKDLVEKYVAGKRDRYSIKASYILRDTIKVIGTKNIKPISFAIFYDDLDNPGKGGTGHTMNICRQNNIPLIDQRSWLGWLNQ